MMNKKNLAPVLAVVLVVLVLLFNFSVSNRQTQAAVPVYKELIELAQRDEGVRSLISKLLDYSIKWAPISAEGVPKGGRPKEGEIVSRVEDVGYIVETIEGEIRIRNQLECVIEGVQSADLKEGIVMRIRISPEEQELFERFNPGKRSPRSKVTKTPIAKYGENLKDIFNNPDFLTSEIKLADRVKALELISKSTKDDWFRYIRETYPPNLLNHPNFNSYTNWASRHAVGELSADDWFNFLSKDITDDILKKNPELERTIRKEAEQLAHNPLRQHLITTLDEVGEVLSLSKEMRGIVSKAPKGRGVISALKSFFQKPGFVVKYGKFIKSGLFTIGISVICDICAKAGAGEVGESPEFKPGEELPVGGPTTEPEVPE